MTKAEIRLEIEKVRAAKQELHVKELELCRKYLTTNEGDERYEEADREVGRGKNKRTIREGRYYWKETYKDEDTGKPFVLDRSRAIRENDKWDNHVILNLI